MQGLIVAAGQGLRLRGVARSKPLAEIRGRPLIDHVIEAGRAGGIDEFVVVTGYLGEPLAAHLRRFADGRGIRLVTVDNPRWSLANGHSVLAAAPWLEERFVLLMADHLFDPGLLSGLLAEPARPSGVTLAIDRRLDNPLVDLHDVTRVRTDGAGAIVEIGKGLEAYDAFDTGVFLAGAPLAQAIAEAAAGGGEASITAGMRRLAARGLARAHDIGEAFWLDVDDEVAHERAQLGGPAPDRIREAS